MSTGLKIAHWALNVLLVVAMLLCFYFSFSADGVVNKVFSVLAGAAFGFLAYMMISYTLKKG